jgi:hypothetical protein
MNAFNAPRLGRTSSAVICRNFLGFVTDSSRSRELFLLNWSSGRFVFPNGASVRGKFISVNQRSLAVESRYASCTFSWRDGFRVFRVFRG